MGRLEEIKARLNAATLGPWRADHAEGEDQRHIWGTGYGEYVCMLCCIAPPDAELIVNAPNDITYLLSEVERLNEAVEFLTEAASGEDW